MHLRLAPPHVVLTLAARAARGSFSDASGPGLAGSVAPPLGDCPVTRESPNGGANPLVSAIDDLLESGL